MATIYETLRLLAACGWRQSGRAGEVRVLTNLTKPGVKIMLEGPLREQLSEKSLQAILRHAGLDEGTR